MPGLALISDKLYDPSQFKQAVELMTNGEASRSSVVASRAGLTIGYSSYPGYPLRIVNGACGMIVVEGAIYSINSSQLDITLRSLLSKFIADPERGRAEIEAFASQADGDFVLLFASATHDKALIINDTLGRLQLFYARNKQGFALAREAKCVRHWLSDGSIDRLAVAQTLLFGWPINNRTLQANINRLGIASSVFIDSTGGTLDIRTYHSWNFEEMEGSADPTNGEVEQLANRLVNCCSAQAHWAAGRPLIVSLSGGLDSRAVAAGYKRAEIDFKSATYRDQANEAAADVTIAKHTADALQIPWKLYSLRAPSLQDAEDLVRLRDGLNFIGVSFILDFLTKLRHDFGSHACYITGDGGHQLFIDLRGSPSIRTPRAFVADQLKRSVWPLDVVLRLLEISSEDVVSDLEEYFSTYPERSISYWNVRFLVLERMLAYLLEGEERNRSFLWSMTPLLCQSFFRSVFAVPARSKSHYRFYARFLSVLEPALSNIAYANWGSPVGSIRGRLRLQLQYWWLKLPRSVRAAVKKKVTPVYKDTQSLQDLRAQLNDLALDQHVTSHISAGKIREISNGDYDRFQLQMIATVLLHVRQAY